MEGHWEFPGKESMKLDWNLLVGGGGERRWTAKHKSLLWGGGGEYGYFLELQNITLESKKARKNRITHIRGLFFSLGLP